MYEVLYYEENGDCPVFNFLCNQSEKEKAKILREIDLLEEYGFALGEPSVKKLTATDLWKLRIKQSTNSFRIFYFCASGQKFVLLHAIRKKTVKTPPRDIQIANARRRRFLERKESHGPQKG